MAAVATAALAEVMVAAATPKPPRTQIRHVRRLRGCFAHEHARVAYVAKQNCAGDFVYGRGRGTAIEFSGAVVSHTCGTCERSDRSGRGRKRSIRVLPRAGIRLPLSAD